MNSGREVATPCLLCWRKSYNLAITCMTVYYGLLGQARLPLLPGALILSVCKNVQVYPRRKKVNQSVELARP